MGADILATIVDRKKEEVAEAKKALSEAGLRQMAETNSRPKRPFHEIPITCLAVKPKQAVQKANLVGGCASLG